MSNDTTERAWEKFISGGTPEQVEAIKSRLPLTVVSAGAGTGKTRTLSQRFAWLLADDKSCKTDQMLVLTFTEKAAREMRERIAKELEDLYDNSKTELPWLHDRIADIDDASISTIHSFAMKITREAGLGLDIDPAFGILPAPAEDVYWEDFRDSLDTLSCAGIKRLLDKKWAERADELFADEDILNFVNEYGPDTLADAAKGASEKFGSAGMSPDDLWDFKDCELLKSQSALASLPEEIWGAWHDEILPAVADLLKCNVFDTSLAKLTQRWNDADPTAENRTGFAADLFGNVLSNLRGGTKAVKGKIEELLGTKLTDWRDNMKHNFFLASPQSDEEKKVNLMLNRTAAIGWQCMEEMKARGNMLSMNDLIRRACDVLKSSDEYRHKFRHILIDEFQDTDPLQDMMIRLLWTGEKGGATGEYNTLFIVGDVKQSIYRFRHADLTLFKSYRDICGRAENKKTCRYIGLGSNFRSSRELLDFFNATFNDVWKEGMGAVKIPYEPLNYPEGKQAEERETLESGEPVSVIAADIPYRSDAGKSDADRKDSAAARLRIYGLMADKIIAMHGAKIIPDKEKGKTSYIAREAKWSDFCVLVPSRSPYAAIENALEFKGVPYVLCTSKNYYGRDEITILTNLISLLAEPGDPLALAAWIASPFSCAEPCKAERLLEDAREARGNEKLPLRFDLTVQKEAPEVWKEIIRLRRIALLHGVPAVLYEIQRRPEFLTSYRPEQRRRVSMNISYLAETAAEYEASQGRSLPGCAMYLQNAVDAAKQQEEPEVTDSEQDAVRVMTIHASKGLQFPITILGEVSSSGSAKSRIGIDISTRYGLLSAHIPEYMTDPHEEKETKCVADSWFADEEKVAESAERERQWYVAMTRACNRLVLCGVRRTIKNGAEYSSTGFLERLLSIKKDDGEPLLPDDVITYADMDAHAEARPHREKNIADKDAAGPMALSVVSPAALGRLSASAYAMLEWCPNAYRIAYRQGRDMQWTVRGGESGGAEFGSLAHCVLRRWDFRAESLGRWLPENTSGAPAWHVPAEFLDEYMDTRARRELRGLLSTFAVSGDGQALAELCAREGAIERETPFRVFDHGLLMVGATDIFWEDESGVHLRDWKTTSEKFAPHEYYMAQLDFYACAKHLYDTGKGQEKPIDAAINYLRPDTGNEAPVKYSAEKIEEIRKEVHKAAEIALSGAFEKTEARCARCPWKKDCLRGVN